MTIPRSHLLRTPPTASIEENDQKQRERCPEIGLAFDQQHRNHCDSKQNGDPAPEILNDPRASREQASKQ